MPDVPDNNLLLTGEGYVTQPAELDDCDCFEPFISQVLVSPVPKPAPKPEPLSLMPVLDRVLRDNGLLPTPTETTPEAEFPTPAAAEGTGDTELAQPSEILPAPVEAPLPPPRIASAAELFTWIRRALSAQTNLPDDAAELVTFWVISTWFQDALTVLPCMVITGAAHEASCVLHVLNNFCREAKLLSGFRRNHLGVLHLGCKTNLISEPNLDRRTAGLLGDLTDKNFKVVERYSLISYAKATAIYAGENPETPKIQNSIHIHIPPTNAKPSTLPQWLQKMTERVPVHLSQYCDNNLMSVLRSKWVPSGLSSELAAIASPLCRCFPDAPELQQRLVALLKTRDKQRQAEMSNTKEAVVVEATRTLSRDGRDHAYSHEIADKANQLFEARGEATRLRAEHVGYTLKGLGLPTHRLSQSGNGLTFDKATVARIHELAAMYMVDVMEDTPAEAENLHSSQTTENK